MRTESRNDSKFAVVQFTGHSRTSAFGAHVLSNINALMRDGDEVRGVRSR